MFNQAQLIGRLGRDPEVRYTGDGKCIANLALATSESHKDKTTGESRQSTEWHRIVLFGRVGEIAGEYLKKGSLVFIEGRIRTRKWTNNAGTEQFTTEIVGQQLRMLDSRTAAAPAAAKHPPAATGGGGAAGPLPSAEDGFDDFFDDDVPFITALATRRDRRGRPCGLC